MSKHTADLCDILVEESCGPLSSLVYRVLLTHGRCSLAALAHHTRLAISQIRQVLAILIQNGFVYWYSAGSVTSYEPNVSSAYSFVRAGKFVQLAEDRHGEVAAGIIKILLRWGHATIQDLVGAMEQDQNLNLPNGHTSSTLSNGLSKSSTEPNGKAANAATEYIDTIEKTIMALLNARLISESHESFFRTQTDNNTEAAMEIREVATVKMSKKDQEALRDDHIQKTLDKWRFGLKGAGDETSQHSVQKRPLETQSPDLSHKRRRLNNDAGRAVNGHVLQATDDGSRVSPKLKPDTTLCVNSSKFAILLRNDRLADLAESRLCSASGLVYRTLLEELQPKLLDCQYNNGRGVHNNDIDSLHVSTAKMASILPDSEPLRNALGTIDNREAEADVLEHPKKRRRKEHAPLESDSEPDHDLEDATDLDPAAALHDSIIRLQASNSDSHEHPVCSHLQLLAQHPFQFVTRVSDPHSFAERWTVDFPFLVRTMQVLEIDQSIASRYGPIALRLINILREHGKLDDRALASLALIREKELRGYLTTMHQDGVLELQEVPRDNARLASRTSFLFFFDHERCVRRLLEDGYKMMTRLLQRSRMEKERVQGLLDKASRSDVVGHEEQLLSQAERDALKQWKRVEEKLWSQVERIDDTVALLRDF